MEAEENTLFVELCCVTGSTDREGKICSRIKLYSETVWHKREIKRIYGWISCLIVIEAFSINKYSCYAKRVFDMRKKILSDFA
jgi:hypothetical protein